jgi:hypothetical protein
VLDADGFDESLWAWLTDLEKRGSVRREALETLLLARTVPAVGRRSGVEADRRPDARQPARDGADRAFRAGRLPAGRRGGVSAWGGWTSG